MWINVNTHTHSQKYIYRSVRGHRGGGGERAQGVLPFFLKKESNQERGSPPLIRYVFFLLSILSLPLSFSLPFPPSLQTPSGASLSDASRGVELSYSRWRSRSILSFSYLFYPPLSFSLFASLSPSLISSISLSCRLFLPPFPPISKSGHLDLSLLPPSRFIFSFLISLDFPIVHLCRFISSPLLSKSDDLLKGMFFFFTVLLDFIWVNSYLEAWCTILQISRPF